MHFFDHFLDDEVEQVLGGLEPVGMEIAVLLQQFTLRFLRTGYSEFA